MKKARACELCNEEASLYCASDAAFLCFHCDARVHQANFLVARHVRQPLCSKCKAFSAERISGAVIHPLRYVCLSCSPEEFSDEEDLDSSSSSVCVSSTESCATGPKRIVVEDRGRIKEKLVKRSLSSSVTEISGEDSSVPVRFDMKNKKKRKIGGGGGAAPTSRVADAKAEGIFVNWCRKLGVNGNMVIPFASKALEFCLGRWTVLPFKVSMAASFWLALRFCGDKSVSTCHNLRGLEDVSGVPAKLILAAEAKVARALRVSGRKAKVARDTVEEEEEEEEGWAECSV
jgi:hypothetical protein